MEKEVDIDNEQCSSEYTRRIEVELDFMHEENDRMKVEYEFERSLLLQKDEKKKSRIKELEQTLDLMKEEYSKNLQHMDSKLRVASDAIERKDKELKELQLIAVKKDSEINELKVRLSNDNELTSDKSQEFI